MFMPQDRTGLAQATHNRGRSAYPTLPSMQAPACCIGALHNGLRIVLQTKGTNYVPLVTPMIFARHAAPLPAWALMLLARDGLGLAVAALPLFEWITAGRVRYRLSGPPAGVTFCGLALSPACPSTPPQYLVATPAQPVEVGGRNCET